MVTISLSRLVSILCSPRELSMPAPISVGPPNDVVSPIATPQPTRPPLALEKILDATILPTCPTCRAVLPQVQPKAKSSSRSEKLLSFTSTACGKMVHPYRHRQAGLSTSRLPPSASGSTQDVHFGHYRFLAVSISCAISGRSCFLRLTTLSS